MNNNTTKPARQFVNGIWIEEKKFDNGNSILKLNVLPDKFIESLKKAEKNEKGYSKFVISKNRDESFSMYIDDWKPTGQSSNPTRLAKATPKTAKKDSPVIIAEEDDDVAF